MASQVSLPEAGHGLGSNASLQHPTRREGDWDNNVWINCGLSESMVWHSTLIYPLGIFRSRWWMCYGIFTKFWISESFWEDSFMIQHIKSYKAIPWNNRGTYRASKALPRVCKCLRELKLIEAIPLPGSKGAEWRQRRVVLQSLHPQDGAKDCLRAYTNSEGLDRRRSQIWVASLGQPASE